MSTVVDFEDFFKTLTTRRTSEMMLAENLRQLEVRIMKEYSGPVTHVPDHIERSSTAAWDVAPAIKDQTLFGIDEESAEPVELISPVEIERLFQRFYRRYERKLVVRRQRHSPMRYFAHGRPVPKNHPDVDEIIMYLQSDIDSQFTPEPPHTDTNSRASTSSESLTTNCSDDKDQAIPGFAPTFHFDNNPPATEISWHGLPIHHARLHYTPTTPHTVSSYNPQSIVFPPTTNVVIAEHSHPLNVFHDALPSARFNPFDDDGPVVSQSSSEGYSYTENANTGQPVFTNPFDDDRVTLSNRTNGIFRVVPNEHTHFSPEHLYATIPTEYAYTQAVAVAHQFYASNQFMYNQYDTASHTNTDDSSSRSSSRTFVDDSELVTEAPRILYWVDRFNKLRKI